MTERDNVISWIYSSRNPEELLERYDSWAAKYDQDLLDEDYKAPSVTAHFVKSYVPTEARILDAGAGTGLMGELLKALGYSNLTAIDLSPRMLEVARGKDAYGELRQMVLGEPLAFPADAFDAVVSTGVFTAAHAPASSFDELVRVTRPGGYIVFTLSTDAYENHGFKEKLRELESAGRWELVETSSRQKMTNDSELYHQVWVFRTN